MQLADNLLRYFVYLSSMAVSVMFAYAGFLYVTAAGNRNNIEEAHKVFSNSLIGIIVILTSFLIVDMIIRVSTGQSLNVLSQIQCVRTEHTDTGFKYTRVPWNNPVTAETGGTPGSAKGDYCSEKDLAGFEKMIGDAIDKHGANLTSGPVAGIEEYCPNYASMTPQQRKVFWTRYMTGVAQYESSCNPESAMNETAWCREHGLDCFKNKDDVTGGDIWSEGLFQLSYGSERRRANSAGDGTCYFDPSKKDIRDPVKNTNCAIFILNQDLGSSGSIGGATRYWSVARSKKAQLIDITKDVPGCR